MQTKPAAPQRGGSRSGSGRPAQIKDAVRVNIYLSAEQRDKMKARGGSEWLRKLIDAAV